MESGLNAVLILVLVFSFAFPLGLLIWWKLKTKVSITCFLAGSFCFILFALILESLCHQVFLVSENPVSEAVNASAFLYVLYTSLSAGVFEETGRFFGFQVLLKNHREKEAATAYGIGHGGIEVILIMGLTYSVYIAASLGFFVGDAETTETVRKIAASIPLGTALTAMAERVSAMLLHLGLSMLVFVSVKGKGQGYLYPAAILLHALCDLPAALMQKGVMTSLLLVELLVFFTGLTALIIGTECLKDYDRQERRRKRREARRRKTGAQP